MKQLLLLVSLLAFSSCIDRDYDLSKVDTDNVGIGDEDSEIKNPLATVVVSMDELSNGASGTIQTVCQEANVWLPTTLPDGDYADVDRIHNDPAYLDGLTNRFIEQVRTDDKKLNEVIDLSWEKYRDQFIPLLGLGAQTRVDTNIDVAAYKAYFKDLYHNDLEVRAKLEAELQALAHAHLQALNVEPLEYKLENINIDDKTLKMLTDNLDPKGTPNPKRTLHLYGRIISKLPFNMKASAAVSPIDVRFAVDVNSSVPETKIPEIQLYAEDLHQIIKGVTIRIDLTLEKYYPGIEFGENLLEQITIDLKFVKRGGLSL